MENSELNLLEEPLQKLVPASLLRRLINYMVDFMIFAILASVLVVIFAPVYPLANKILHQKPFQPVDIDMADQLVLSFAYGLYMSVMEALLKGKSIGKFITGTRAVSLSGYPISSNTAFVRGLIRMVPFEFLSIFFSLLFTALPLTWHDRWSASVVIDEAKSIVPPAN